MSLVGTEHPYSRRRMDRLVQEIEAALVGGDERLQSQLVRDSTDLLVKRWSCLPADGKPAYDALLSDLLGRVDTAARVGFAGALARLRRGPPQTSSRLAHDPVTAVAAPLLEGCRSLDPALLADVAASCGDGHRAALAGRPSLPQELTDLLLDRCGCEVATRLAANLGAAFSARGFEHLVRHAGASEALALHLVVRADLPDGARTTLCTLARERAAASLAEDGVPTARSAALIVQAVAPRPEPAPERVERFAASVAFMTTRYGVLAPSGDTLVRWLALKRIEDALAALAHRASLPVAFVVDAYDAQDGMRLALVLHGSGYAWTVLKALLLFRLGAGNTHLAIEQAYPIVQQLSPLSARRLVRLAALPLPAAAFGPGPPCEWSELAAQAEPDERPSRRLSA